MSSDRFRKFKHNTYLTDGKNVIKIGYVHQPDWTPSNNYGHKMQVLTDCTTYPKNLFVYGIKTVQEKYRNEIPSLWFQNGYHLSHFMEINRKLLNIDVITALIAI